ncbi:hypothetical protein [Nocardia sp. NBC_00403]|uniref:hypothetical protein n=1 Tax=Nocardia sp. NBC_00403 TaxID=2975990 RepID=UPI002E1FCFA0
MACWSNRGGGGADRGEVGLGRGPALGDIGKATAELLQSRGYRVMVTGVDNVANAGLPEDVVIIQADARSLPDIDHAMDQARRQLPHHTRAGIGR